MNCWHKRSFPLSRNASSTRSASVDMTGRPGSHAFPTSITIEPRGLRSVRRGGAKPASQSMYAWPCRLPYFFLRLSGNGGEVKTRSIFPWQRFNILELRASSAVPRISLPSFVEYEMLTGSVNHHSFERVHVNNSKKSVPRL